MAIHANSTTAPARPLLPPPARDARGRFAGRAELPPEPLLQAEAPEPATLDDVRREMEALLIESQAKMRPADEYDAAQERGEVESPGGDRTSIVPLRNNAPATAEDLGLTRKDTPDAGRHDLDALVARRGDIPTRDAPAQAAQQTARRKELYEMLHPETAHGSPSVSRQIGDTRGRADTDRFTADTAAHTGRPERSIQRDAPAAGGCHMSTPWELPAEPDTAARARTLHLRRQLTAAVERGADFLAALGLPRPVDGDFIAIDPRAAGDAIEAAIGALDALDAPGEDMEDGHDEEWSLGWAENGFKSGDSYEDREDDSEEDEGTSLETAGRGFVRAGDDDAEEDDAAEESDEPEGDGGEPYLSVVEWDGRGDNWGRTGPATSGWGTDVEGVNEGGDGAYDAPWWDRPGSWPAWVGLTHG